MKEKCKDNERQFYTILFNDYLVKVGNTNGRHVVLVICKIVVSFLL